ncbi:MAG TPA: hypothetical protein VJK54_11905, partial [Chthoniobacterales bacterium]|nr:hypothetical protein [Chthoniobacterales bacterium]
MKILYSLLLGAWITSTNSNFLLAQDENRLKATNQVIGCRLQMPLQRQEMEDRRWKMEVEAQGCSFQNIEGRVMNENEYKDVDNQSSFLANDSVPISHLPSSSYYLGITPKLMMNPETTRDLGGILKFSRNPFKDFMNLSRNPLFPSKASSEREILNAAQVSPIEEGSSISDVIENNSKNNKNSDLTNNENIEKYFTDIKEKILVLTEQIEAAKQASKEQLGGENSYLWDRIATKLEQARDSWHKVNRLLSELAYFDEVQGVDGAQNLSVQTSSMVRAPERRSNSLKEVEYQVVGRPRDRLLQVEAWNSQYFQGRPRDRLLQVEAWNSQYFQGRPRDRLRRIKFEQPERQAERERASQFGKESSELVEQGSIERVTLWRKAAEESEAAAEGIRQAVQAYISGQKKSAEQLEKETWSAYYLSDAATWSLKSEEALEKTNQMRGESEDFWRDLSEQYHIAADYEKKASEAHKANKKDERNSCCWVGRYLHSSAERKLKAMEAREAGKEELAVGYQDASEVFQQAAEQRKKAIAVYTLGKESEGHSWAWSADSLQKKADYLVKACEAHEANKATLAFGYREAAITSGRAADQWKLSAETKAAGKTNEGNCWGWVGDSLQAGADYQAKVCEAEEAGKKILGAGYGEVVAILKHAADQYKQSALTSAAGKQNESDSWYLVGKSLQAMADYQAKASEAEETGKLTLATGYREAAATFERAASQRKLAAETKAAGKESEGNSWGWVGRSLQAKADYQVKASEAEEAGKTILAFGYREAVTILGRAADQWKLSA